MNKEDTLMNCEIEKEETSRRDEFFMSQMEADLPSSDDSDKLFSYAVASSEEDLGGSSKSSPT